jgi:glutamyl-tRNA reductase
MDSQYFKNISNFYVAGINYKKSDACTRGQFAVAKEQYAEILRKAPEHGLTELFVLSTCNRTEIYGFAQHPSQLIELICSETIGDSDTFKDSAYIKKRN